MKERRRCCPGVDPHRVQVFHVADGDAGTGPVLHHFVLYFFPPHERPLEKHLVDRTRVEAVSNDAFQFRVGRCHAAARAAQRVGRSYDQRQWDIHCKLECLIERRDDRAVNDRLSNAIQEISKQRAVFCLLDGGKRRAQQANAVSFEDPAIRDLNRQVESRLTPRVGSSPSGRSRWITRFTTSGVSGSR